MIQANEMRIGNLFWDEDNTPCYFAGAWQRQDGWICRDSANNTYKESEMFPIPLTPEILEKVGFEKEIRGKKEDFDGVEFVYHRNGIDIYDHTGSGNIGFSYATYTRYPGRGFKAGFSIQSLHQLQNLYFALTGQELEITL